MKITLLVVGKTKDTLLNNILEDYASRVKKYMPFSIIVIPDLKNVKNLSIEEIKREEGKRILAALNKETYVIILDEHGEEYSSPGFAKLIQQKANSAIKHLYFIIGGAYGFSEDVYKRCNEKQSLSKMTFPHQIVRLIFAEQLYRAFTILKGEPYHHS